MSVTITENIILKNPETRAFLADTYHQKSNQKLPLIIFVHGYKGYKDWGAWELMAKKYAEEGFFFVKFNFSHNGTTLDEVHHFADLEAFGQNNYSKEMSDLSFVIDHFSQFPEVDSNLIFLMGHSRGNGNILIKASEDDRIKALVGLAGISDYGSRFPPKDILDQIKKVGVMYIENQRTKQQMPHYYQFFEDFENNAARFNIQSAAKKINIPYLIIHGTDDETVNIVEADDLHQWTESSELFIIENGNHSFGSTEPWPESIMPQDLEIATEKSINFLKVFINR